MIEYIVKALRVCDMDEECPLVEVRAANVAWEFVYKLEFARSLLGRETVKEKYITLEFQGNDALTQFSKKLYDSVLCCKLCTMHLVWL